MPTRFFPKARHKAALSTKLISIKFITMNSSSCDSWRYILAFVSSFLVLGISKLFVDLYWRPRQFRRIFKQQGIPGPEPQFFYGNLVQIRKLNKMEPANHVFDCIYPFYRQWSKTYGDIFLFWLGIKPCLMLSDPETIKTILMSKSFDREPPRPVAEEMFGQGVALVRMNHKWSHQRKMVGAAFTMKKLQSMIVKMTSCVQENLQRWFTVASLDADLELRSITSDVICRTVFGTNYEAGKKVFEMQVEQARIIFEWESQVHFPGSSYLPSSRKRYRKKLKTEIERIIHGIVTKRLEDATDDGDDMLGMLLSSEKSSPDITLQMVIDECKTFFFTGQETSAGLLAWTIMLLGTNQKEQQILRDEVIEILKYSPPTTLEELGNLKKMEMVIQEALRLFPPIPRLKRYAWQDMKLGDLFIPKGTILNLPLIVSNYSEHIWGKDVGEFRPQRFENVDKRSFMPFSIGPRTCIGQNFAMLEVKIILVMILQRFQFELGEGYVHSPSFRMTLRPEFGIPIKLCPLHAT